MADSVTSNAQTAAFKKAEIIGQIVQKILIHKSVLIPTVWDLSKFAVPGSSSIKVPKFTNKFTVVDRVSGVAGEAQSLTGDGDVMNLDINAYIAWIIDSMDLYQSSVDMKRAYVEHAAGAHSVDVDAKIITELAAVFSYTALGDTVRDRFLDARKKLLDRSASIQGLTYACSTADEAILLKVKDFVRADSYGTSAIPNGEIGRLYGVPVKLCPSIATGGYLYHQEAIGIGFQKAPKYAEQSDIRYGTDGGMGAIDQLYGVKGLQIAQGGAAAGKSAWVTKIDLSDADLGNVETVIVQEA